MQETKEINLLVYTPEITNRLQYIFKHILAKELGLHFELCNDKSNFENSELYKLSYSFDNYFPKFPFLKASGLLTSSTVEKTKIDIITFKDIKAFFKSDKDSFFPFDIFSASFYLLSRYEEYLPFRADRHGRFQANQSLAFNEGFLEQPIVNIWINHFKNYLKKEFPDLNFKTKQFGFLSTIDIDNAYGDLHKGVFRTLLSFTKLAITFRLKPFINKIKVLRHIIADKFDNYDYLNQIHNKFQFNPVYFILFSKYSKFDTNQPHKNKAFIKLIESISKQGEIGIHPSYRSNKSIKIVECEKKELEKLIKRPIVKSRQHYLKFKLPDTYKNLISLGIEKDYSMGYASMPGFRASTCTPFSFYNLISDEETNLEIVPFAIMDATFIHYLKSDYETSLNKMKEIINSVKKVNGLFVSLWHNENLSETNSEMKWRNVFEQMLKEIKDGNPV